MTIMSLSTRLLLAVVLALVLHWGAHLATAGTALDPALVRAELVSEVVAVQPGRPFWVAVRLGMKEGWHVNWINPGDAGLAPNVAWVLPEGFTAGDIQWPYPERFALPELLILGYEKNVLLMVEMRPPADLAADRVELQVQVEWLACREVCIPGQARLALELPVRTQPPQSDPKWAAEFESTRSRVPVASSDWRFSARMTADAIVISATPSNGNTMRIEEMIFYPTAQGVIEHAMEQKLKQTARGYDLDIVRARMSSEKPTRIRGVLVSREGWGAGLQEKALEIDVPVE